MSPGEILWRLGQKKKQLTERRKYKHRRPVTSAIYKGLSDATFDAKALGLVAEAPSRDMSVSIKLLGGYSYSEYATAWHAGFQTQEQWPLTWAYDLRYKQCDAVGDARTNWELNRHRQFVLMAKAYAVGADREILRRLATEFDDWNAANPFLYGISWTSPMEIAIRAISWMYTLAFLERGRSDELAGPLRENLRAGSFNMISYLLDHYSRFSSANNHLIVEMLAIGMGGLAFGREDWLSLAIATLDRELPLQNSPDGVNLEMSLHYHAFVMEAYLLLMRALRLAGRDVPRQWVDMMTRMATFVAASRVADGVYCSFGDDDEGHILDFSAGTSDYYRYILQLASLECSLRFDTFDTVSPTVRWLYPARDIDRVALLPEYDSTAGRSFEQGGYTFLRSRSGSLMAGFDHAPLGFGAIAAHGHADALSFQLFADGRPFFVDPGTYIYHIRLDERNAFRSTLRHNTVMIDGVEQSEMRGAFLWGRKAETYLIGSGPDFVEAHTEGLSGVGHTRRLTLSDSAGLCVTDRFDRHCEWIATFILAPGLTAQRSAGRLIIDGRYMLTSSHGEIRLEETEISISYGKKLKTMAIRIYGCGDANTVAMTKL